MQWPNTQLLSMGTGPANPASPDLDLAHELKGWWESEGCRQERRSRRKQLTLSQLGFDRIPMSDLSKRDLLYGINVDGVRSCVKRSKYSHGISRKKLYNALKGGIVQQKVDEVLNNSWSRDAWSLLLQLVLRLPTLVAEVALADQLELELLHLPTES